MKIPLLLVPFLFFIFSCRNDSKNQQSPVSTEIIREDRGHRGSHFYNTFAARYKLPPIDSA